MTVSESYKGRIAKLVLTAVAAVSSSAAYAVCYPGTASNPLEKEVVIESTGGTAWDAIKKVVIEPFEKECGVKVVLAMVTQRSLAQVQQFVRSGNPAWDLGLFSTPWDYANAKKLDLIEPLPKDFWKAKADNMLPGSFDGLGIALNAYSTIMIYNTKSFPNGMKTWADFWDVAKYPGPRSLHDNPTNVIIALLADGVAPKDVYPITDAKLKRAYAKLSVLRPSIRTYWTVGDQPVQGVNRQDFVAASSFNSRAFAGMAAGYNIATSWEGNILSNTWFYRPRKGKNPNAAAAFMYFYANRDVQAEYAKLTGNSGYVKGLLDALPANLKEAMPTSPKNLASHVPVDADWWAANGTRMNTMWREWVSSGSVASLK